MPRSYKNIAGRAVMPSSVLGRNGPIVSRLALGTMTFGAETEEAEAHRQIDMFVDQGGTLIDTADIYSDGASEEIIGRWGDNRRGLGDMIIATKGRFSPPSGSHGAARRALVRSVDTSFRRLQVEAIAQVACVACPSLQMPDLRGGTASTVIGVISVSAPLRFLSLRSGPCS